MNSSFWFAVSIASILNIASQEVPSIQIVRDGDLVALKWPVIQPPVGAQTVKYQLERSEDLSSWLPFGVPVRSAASGQTVSRTLDPERTYAFYRVSVSPETGTTALAEGGAEVFGYSELFQQELARIGRISPQQFSERYDRHPPYVHQMPWDPTNAEFWSAFNTDPAVYNRDLIPNLDDLRQFDFRLNPTELALFKKNGFVVSQRLGAYSCGEVYNHLWIDDLPVFVTTDSVLQAWHRSYDMMLAEIETTVLRSNLDQMLGGMASSIARLSPQVSEALRESLLDADYYLSVARSLLNGFRGAVPSALNQDARVKATLDAIANEKLEECFSLFGFPRAVDFSQFKPRGHYDDPYNFELRSYFQALMWLGRIDLRIAGGPFQDSTCEEPHHARLRDLGTAIVLSELLRDSGQYSRWEQTEKIISTFVGWTDSLTFRQLREFLTAAGISSLSEVKDTNTLAALQSKLELGSLGGQTIASDFFVAPFEGTAALPQSFTVFGQKFVPDSWALSQVVADRILWVENGQTNVVNRRMPSALDVAFSVLHNDQVVPNLVTRISNASAAASPEWPIKYRDGLPYQHNLAAVREVIDQHPASAWTQNIYMGWLDLLRQLSPPIADDLRVPAAMRTHAWAMKDLNTQLASWTELRHDTILYTKQSSTISLACSYPKGFIEPRLDFWKRFQLLAEQTSALIAGADYGTATALQEKETTFLNYFGDVCRKLYEMADKELRQSPFSDAEVDFISTTLVGFRSYVGYWTVKDGWYPKLFYQSPYVRGNFQLSFDQAVGATRWDPLVADVHTDFPCGACDDPGGILHEGTGNAGLLLIAIDNGTNRCVYAGPVLSHYEFPLKSSNPGSPTRLSDFDWQVRFVRNNQADPTMVYDFRGYTGPDPYGSLKRPEWTEEYLVW